MKCARELIEMKQEAINTWETAKQENIMALGTAAIEFCEKIGKELEEKAQARQPLEYFVKLDTTTNKYGHEVARTLVKDSYGYADGTASYHATSDGEFSFEVMQDYFKMHCIETKVSDSCYARYGWGSLSCKLLRVYVPANLKC